MRTIHSLIFFRLAIFLIVLFAFSVQLTGQFEVEKIPSEILPFAQDVVREENMRIEVKSESNATLYVRKAITLLTEESNANQFVSDYTKDCRIKRLQISLYNKNGQFIRKAEKSEYQDRPANQETGEYSDVWYKYLTINHNEYPYTIVIEYEKELSGMYFAAFPDWGVGCFGRAVEKADIVVDVPAGFDIQYRSIQLDVEPEIKAEDSRKIFSWYIRNLRAVPEEPLIPAPGELLPHILISPARFQIDNYSGSLESWEDYSAFIHRLFEEKNAIPDDLKIRVEEITESASSIEQKVNLLYNLLQNEMRYVSIQFGIGGWQPFDPAFVHEKKYGDCKALTNYMYAMLKTVGITSFPALVQSGYPFREIQNDFATPEFNHVILYVPEADLWLECTSNSYPQNYIGSSNSGRKALLIKRNGGGLISTPTFSAQDNKESHRILIDLKKEGAASISIHHLASGYAHEPYRYLAHHLSYPEQLEWLNTRYNISTFSTETFHIEAHDSQPKSKMQIEADIERYAARAGQRLFVSLNQFTAFANIPPEVEERIHDVVFREGHLEVDTIKIELPEGYMVESLFEEHIEFESVFGNYLLEIIERKPSSITLRREFEIFQTRQAPEFYEDLCSFLKNVAQADAQKLVLLQEKP